MFLRINKWLKIVKNLIFNQLFDMESTMVIKHQGWMLISRFVSNQKRDIS